MAQSYLLLTPFEEMTKFTLSCVTVYKQMNCCFVFIFKSIIASRS